MKHYKNAPPLRAVNLRIWLHEGNLMASYRNNLTGEVSAPELRLKIDRAMLAHKLHNIESVLSEISFKGIWSNLHDPLGPAPTNLAQSIYDELMATVISEGAALFKEFSEEQEFGEFVLKLDALPDGSSITVETDCALLPWEILYPVRFNKYAPQDDNNFDYKRLWGYRFQFEYILLPKKGSWQPPLSEHRRANTFVSLNLNPTIDKEFIERPYKPIQRHRDFYENRLRGGMGELLMSGEQIKELLLSDSKATIIYLYCHGQSDDPFSGKGWEKLQLDENSYIEPATLDVRDSTYKAGPIVILNSCSSGAYSPLSFNTFHSKFLKKRALGVIGTTIPMPATFAAAFGQKLIESYIYDGLTIGNALLSLRRDLLIKGNPLGLFYTLQCPLHVTASAIPKR